VGAEVEEVLVTVPLMSGGESAKAKTGYGICDVVKSDSRREGKYVVEVREEDDAVDMVDAELCDEFGGEAVEFGGPSKAWASTESLGKPSPSIPEISCSINVRFVALIIPKTCPGRTAFPIDTVSCAKKPLAELSSANLASQLVVFALTSTKLVLVLLTS